MLRTVRVIVFDWGGTLVRVARQDETRAACAAAACARLRRAGWKLPNDAPADLLAAFLELSAHHEAVECPVELDTNALLASWCRRWGLPSLDGQAEVLGEAFWEPWIGCLDVLPGALAAVARLRETGYRLGLTSNCAAVPAACRAEVARQGFGEALDFTLFSSELGFRKPGAPVYEETLRRARTAVPGVRADEILFVGDTPVADVEGPRRAGMRTALVRTGAWRGASADLAVAPDFVVESVAVLPELLGG